MRNKVHRIVDGHKIYGELFHGFVKNFNYHFAEIAVYADGMIQCWELMTLAEFKKRLNSGWVCISLPKDTSVYLHNIGELKLSELIPVKTNEDFIKEIEDAITRLNGGIDRIQKCINAFKNYLLNDSEINFDILKELYEDLPSHQRVLFEYVDYKDPLVGLMQERETWTTGQRKFMLEDYFDDEWNEEEFTS